MVTDADRKVTKIENKQKIVELENFYVNAQIDNLPELVEQKKDELVTRLQEVNDTMRARMIENPYLISIFFFKSINPLANTEPDYSSEKLAIVWELYMYLVEQVNIEIGIFKPTITHFCKFAGISLNRMKTYKDSSDLQMRLLVEKIYDETFDSNLTLAQSGILKDRSTIFRLKSENEVQEKPTVNVNVHVEDTINLDEINKRMASYSEFSTKKKKVKEADYVERANEK